MAGKGKKILLGIVSVLVLAAGGIALYAWYFASQHETEYGKKGRMTKAAAQDIEAIEKKLKACRKEVFTHADLGVEATTAEKAAGYEQGIANMVKELKTCVIGQLSKDKKGYSNKMDPKHLKELLGKGECKAFADKVASFKYCSSMITSLPELEQYKDTLLGDLEGGDDAGGDTEEGMEPAAMDADDMDADGMDADGMKAGGMKADGMNPGDMDADGMKVDGMNPGDMDADGMRAGAMK